MKRQKINSGQSFRIALLFSVLTIFLICAGLLVKLWLLFSSSQFDGHHQFIVAVKESNSSDIINFSPDSSSVVILHIQGQLSNNVPAQLGIPVDANVQSSETVDSISDFAQHLLLQKNITSRINILDRIRLFLFANTIKQTDVKKQTLKVPLSQTTLDQIVSTNMVDHSLYSENVTIALVNATGVSGVGSSLAKKLSNIGANIISVTTSSDTQKSSSLVYAQGLSYTPKRIGMLLHVTPKLTQKGGLSDITITIGTDSIQNLSL